jgi:preprotein translocase subunit SecD
LKKGLDIQGGVHLRLEVDKDKLGTNPSVKEVSDAADRALEIIRNRVDGLGRQRTCPATRRGKRHRGSIAGFSDIKHAQEVISTTAQLQFRLVTQDRTADFKKADGSIDTAKLPKGAYYFQGQGKRRRLHRGGSSPQG